MSLLASDRQMPDFSFSKSKRLLQQQDFKKVFEQRNVFYCSQIKIFYCLKEIQHRRLGLIVSKKTAKRAVKRNYMKRVLREWFRYNQDHLPAGDYIFLIKRAFDHSNLSLAKKELALFMKKCERWL